MSSGCEERRCRDPAMIELIYDRQLCARRIDPRICGLTKRPKVRTWLGSHPVFERAPRHRVKPLRVRICLVDPIKGKKVGVLFDEDARPWTAIEHVDH